MVKYVLTNFVTLTVVGNLPEVGTVGMRFTSVDALQEAKDNIYFSNMVGFVSCIKIIAKVRDNKDIAVLIDFMNGLRKVASKHLIVKMQTLLNTTLLEKISINYEVTIHEGDTGSTNQR